MSNEALDLRSRSHYSFGRWLAPRMAISGVAVSLLTGILGLGQHLIR